MKEPCAFQPQLRIVQALAFFADQRLGADLAPFEHHLGMTADVKGFHGRNVAHDFEPGRALVHDEPGNASVGAGHDDGEVGSHRTADKPLVAVDDPAASFFTAHRTCGGGQHARVGAGARRGLGHGKARAHVATRKRREIARALCGAGQCVQCSDVGLAGRRALQRDGAEKAAACLLQELAALFPRQAKASFRDRQAWRAQAARAGALTESGSGMLCCVAIVGVGQDFRGDDFAVYEVAQIVHQQGECAGRSGEAHG